ncbi:MAG: hypothetical protein M3Z23_10595 [Acidobacteriota bacterium]|nr:hypothetical protein [Acidobacteriota bacterium]
MTANSPVENLSKIARIWSSAREREIAVKIYYDLQIEGACKIYSLNQVEEID